MASSLQKAKKAKGIVLKASKDIFCAHEYFRRPWDNLFEDGDGLEVIKEFVKLYNIDNSLQKACKKVDHYIGIENWLSAVSKSEPVQMTLF